MRPRLRNLPLFWKILVPFMTLMLVVGVFGAFLIVRTLTTRAQNELDQDLARRSLEARSTLRDREVSLLESANLAANLEGMARAITARDTETVARLAESTLALKTDLNTLVIVDRSGRGLAEFVRSPDRVRRVDERVWSDEAILKRALAETTTGKHADLLTIGRSTMLAIAAPVCSASPGCSPTGVAIVAIPVADAVVAANVTPIGQRASVSIYDGRGALLASAGPIAAEPKARATRTDAPIRLSRTVGEEDVATLYTPYELQGRAVGRLGVSVPSGPAFASTREAAVRLGLILVMAMAGVVALGAFVSRRILAQVKPLVAGNRKLGTGDLTARVPVLGEDELGELALGVNKMAEQLQASYETLESRVAERTEEVQRLLQERTEFFAAISHELRTPLAVIIAQAELMRDPTHAKTPKWTAQTGTSIGDSAAQLLSLVNDILDLARAEAGRLVVSIEDVDLAESVEAIRPTIEGLARAGEIDVTITVPSPLPVRADPARLRAIILNLVDNAVKYTPPRGRIRLTAAQGRIGMVEVSVSDTGIGIPSDIGDRVFEPFFRVMGSETQRGQASSGLGLALARRLVEAHGGTISYKAGGVMGTTFRFTLPVPRGQAASTKRSGSGARRRAARK